MEDTTLSGFGDILKAYRKRRKISQQELASRLNVHRNTIGVWERGDFLPESKTMILELAKQLCLNELETRRLLEASLTAITPYWNVPYQRNPFFTGREQLLQQIHEVLRKGQTVALTQPYALTGLGGIGKTQVAVEYAYRSVQEYTASCWINAETTEAILSSFSLTAHLFNLPEKQEQDQKKMVLAVLRWFSHHRNWLLIYDNVEDIAVVTPFLPSGPHQGHVLMTTRMQVTEPVALSLQLENLPMEEGALLLLRRIRRLSPDEPLSSAPAEEQRLALALSEQLSGLPLALDQAGAYILETGCLLSDYLSFYEQRHDMLLARRGSVPSEHPESVATTFSLVFERAERRNQHAAELLRLCAFLAPDAIPEALITGEAEAPGSSLASLVADPLALNEAMKTLRSLSLIQRNPHKKMLSLHRLVQTVLKDEMSEDMQHAWINRCIRLLDQSFPEGSLIVEQWDWCEQLVPHVLVNVARKEAEGTSFLEEASLSHKTAVYLRDRAQFTNAETLFQLALRIREHVLGRNHPDVARSLNDLAILYKEQGRYTDAEQLYRRALHIREQMLGPNHCDVARTLGNWADLYTQQGKYTDAEPFYQRALSIREQMLGPDHLDVALSLNNLAVLYWRRGRYTDAELFYQRALRIREEMLGPDHPDIAQTLSNLAILYGQQGKYEQTEVLCRRALSIVERTLGPDHPNVAICVSNLAELSFEQGKYEQAESLYQRSLRIWEQALGANHALVAHPLHGLANLYRVQGNNEQARQFYQRALRIREQTLGLQHPETGDILYDFALFLEAQGNCLEAESLYHQALTVREQSLGSRHQTTVATRVAYMRLLRELGREEEAIALDTVV
jgi:tetratricopeptide (TPR) repeat protein/DNA-binding XRE family transcriptional regulator